MEAAAVNFLKAVELDPRDPEMYYAVGGTYMLLRRYEEAERHLNKALSLGPDQM